MTTKKFDHILATAEFIRENKEELMKDISAYEHILQTLKKAIYSGTTKDTFPKTLGALKLDKDSPEVMLHHVKLHEKAAFKATTPESKAYHMKHANEIYEHATSLSKATNEEDEAAKWLKEQESSKPKTDKQEKTYSKDWEPRTDYSSKEAEAIKKLMGDGYSHREAERLAGAHRGPKNYQAALKSGINPSTPSDKMMGHLKGLAKEWLDNARSHDLANADEMKNPVKHASGQMEQAHKGHTKDYHQAYSDFLSSDDVKDLSPRNRHKAVQEWKGKWKQENPDYEEGLDDVSQVQSKFADAAKNIEQKNKETSEHIARGGVSEVPDMTDQEAMQHLGGGKSEEGYTGGSIVKDPAAAFAAKNPRYVKLLNQDQMDRIKRVDSASALQGKVRIKKKQQEPQG